MKLTIKTTMLVAALSLAACSNANRFGGGYGDGGAATAGGGYGSGGIDTQVLDPASDPKSPTYFKQTIGDRVLFAVDQHTLSGTAMATLDAQARWLMQNDDYDAIIEGHADEQGTREYNIGLSARRAEAVKNYLISQGINATRLRTVPYGKERPIEVCSEESCYAKNRRAVTVISALGLTG